MRQYCFLYKNAADFIEEIRRTGEDLSSPRVLFRICSDAGDKALLEEAIATLKENFPAASYAGAISVGNIVNGSLAEPGIAVSAIIMESESTSVEVRQIPLREYPGRIISDICNMDTGIKAVEFYIPMAGLSGNTICGDLSDAPESVVIFGCGACSANMRIDGSLVFSNRGGISSTDVVFVIYRGEDFHVETSYVSGWKPLGRKFKISRVKGNRLYELDGIPAYDTYYKYLQIKNDENFLANTLEFPFLYENKGMEMLRAPVSCNSDGSVTLSADMELGSYCTIAYGDPEAILTEVLNAGQKAEAFRPQVITLFSCVSRKIFWNGISDETIPFETVASASGLYTAGEFVRTGKSVNQHNVTLVIAAMREGDGSDYNGCFKMEDSGRLGRKLSMVTRLANFIDAATKELEEANEQLREASIRDGLTELFNRSEIQRRISLEVVNAVRLDNERFYPSIIMIDIDDFKHVNDICGHHEGDVVLKALSRLLEDILTRMTIGFDTCAGRWGGEEFMVLLPTCPIEKALEIAEEMRKEFAEIVFPQAGSQTISLGVAQATRGESVDRFCGRVDKALYDAKHAGKNKVMVK